MYAALRLWMKGGAMPDDPELEEEMNGVLYGYDADGATVIERKEDAKKRGLASPDRTDALALTFAEIVAPKTNDTALIRHAKNEQEQDWNPYANEAE